jgi:hypothetical protein
MDGTLISENPLSSVIKVDIFFSSFLKTTCLKYLTFSRRGHDSKSVLLLSVRTAGAILNLSSKT